MTHGSHPTHMVCTVMSVYRASPKSVVFRTTQNRLCSIFSPFFSEEPKNTILTLAQTDPEIKNTAGTILARIIIFAATIKKGKY